MASTHSREQPGGLTTVIERLVAETSPTHHWTWLVRLDQPDGGSTEYWRTNPERRQPTPFGELRIIAPRDRTQALLRRVGWTIFQPGGLALAPALYGWALRGSVRRQVPRDIEHMLWVGTGIELLGFELLRAARRLDIPFTVWPALHPREWGDAAIDARLYRAADAVVVLSDFERGHVERMGVPPERIHVVPLGPTVAPGGVGARFRSRHQLADDELVVTYMARRSTHKGLRAVVEAARALQGRGRRFTLAVAGPPGDVTGLPDDPWLLDLGLCTEPDKADLLAATDVFCVPSTSESLGIVYLDAWSVGVPVVAGLAPAVRELVEEGVDGFCVSHDRNALADRVERLLDAPALRRAMGAAGQAKQRERFTWAACADLQSQAFAQAAAVASARSGRRPRHPTRTGSA